jgi:non-ribosomal peptide synthetase component E (peptide arylation enzyme)
MATLFVLDVPEFAPLQRAARQAGLAVQQADGGYLRFDGAPELALERARAGLGKAVWYGALTAGYVGRVVRFDDDRLVISDAPCANERTRPARALPGVQFHEPEQVRAWMAAGAWLDLTIVEACRAAAAAVPAAPFIVQDGRTLDFATLERRSDGLAASLLALGLAPGERVIFQMGSTIETVVALFGCFKAGLIPVCTLPQYREIEIGALARQSGATGYIVQADFSPSFDLVAFARRMAEGMPLKALIVARGEPGPGAHRFERLCERAEHAPADVAVTPADVALFQLSGGSTGVPKIIPRMHGEYLGSAAAWNQRHRLTRADVALWSLPLIHNAAMLIMLMPALLQRRCVILQERFEIQAFLAAIREHRVTYGGSIGPIAPRLLERDRAELSGLASLRMFFTLARADALDAHTGVPTQTIFGITEGLLMASPPDAPAAARFGTCGTPTGLADEIKVLVPGTPDPAPEGQVGELVFRGAHTLRGYYGDPAATAAAFTADGFFRSGDLVRAVRVGGAVHYVFEGRLKDNINRGGEKFGAAEVEELLARHPAVGDVAVVAMPDPILGEKACAFIVARPGQRCPDVAALAAFLTAQGLARFKQPERVEAIDAFPTTRVGKIDKAALRKHIAEALAAEHRDS